jgi:hypothetical protein
MPSTFMSRAFWAACLINTIAAVDPAAVYNGSLSTPNSPILLRIGNGGAGQSGLVKGRFTSTMS